MKTNYYRFVAVTFALFALSFFAPHAQAHSPRARELLVTVQSMRPEARAIVVIPIGEGTPHEFVWTKSTQFIEDWRFVDASMLKKGMKAKIYYHTPFFGMPYVSKIMWLTESPPPQKK